MQLRPVRVLVMLLGVALLAAACAAEEDTATATTAGVDLATGSETGSDATAAPAFTAERLGGGEFDAASLEGRNTVLWFWAPWCTTCRAEAPEVVEAAGEFEGSVEVIGVAGRGDIAAMEEFVEQTGTGGLDHVVDDDGSIWTQFGVAAQPAFAFIDGDGEVDVFVGTLGSDGLNERMQALAAG